MTAGKIRPPAALEELLGQSIADRCDGRLKPAPVSTGTKSDQDPAIRATVSPKKDRFMAAFEIGPHESMPPEAPPAPGTARRTGPRELPAQFENLLDADVHKEYQGSIFCCSGVSPEHRFGAEGVPASSAPSHIKKASHEAQDNPILSRFSSIHSEKSLPVHVRIFRHSTTPMIDVRRLERMLELPLPPVASPSVPRTPAASRYLRPPSQYALLPQASANPEPQGEPS
jgi:hypothetical protein